MRHYLFIWLAIAVAFTIAAGLIYVSVQQGYRQTANDPQIGLAKDWAGQLNAGVTTPKAISSGSTVDIATSLAPFVVIYSRELKPIAGTGLLDGSLPTPPPGVFDSASRNGENRLTWQPEPGVRQAIVIRPYSGGDGGFILVGRSLREVEKREQQQLALTVTAWLAGLFLTFVTLILGRWYENLAS